MSYKIQQQAEQYINEVWGNDTDGYDDEAMITEFRWLVHAVLSDPTHARESLIDAIKSHTK